MQISSISYFWTFVLPTKYAIITDTPVNNTITVPSNLGLSLIIASTNAPKAVPVIIIPILNHRESILLPPVKLRSLMSIPFSSRIIFSLNRALLTKYQARNNPAIAINARINSSGFGYSHLILSVEKRLQNNEDLLFVKI
jgi:hypothetical protein